MTVEPEDLATHEALPNAHHPQTGDTGQSMDNTITSMLGFGDTSGLITYVNVKEITTDGGIDVEFTCDFDETRLTNFTYEWIFICYLRMSSITGGYRAYARLYNVTDAAAIAGSEVSTLLATWTKLEITIPGANLPATGIKTFKFQIKVENATRAVFIRRARVTVHKTIQ